jgi:hypothetical protein
MIDSINLEGNKKPLEPRREPSKVILQIFPMPRGQMISMNGYF